MSGNNSFKKIWNKYPVWCNLLLMVVTIVVIGWLLLSFVDMWTHHGATSVVPDVKGMEYDQAVEVLADANLDVVVSDSVDNPGNLRGGTVMEVIPKPGSVVKKGREVYVTIVAYSARKVLISEPLANRDLKSVLTVLGNLGFDTSNVTIKRIPWLYPGSVIAVHANDATIDIGSQVPVNAHITIDLGIDESLPDDYDYSALPDSLSADGPDNAEPLVEEPENQEPADLPDEEPVTTPSNPLYD